MDPVSKARRKAYVVYPPPVLSTKPMDFMGEGMSEDEAFTLWLKSVARETEEWFTKTWLRDLTWKQSFVLSKALEQLSDASLSSGTFRILRTTGQLFIEWTDPNIAYPEAEADAAYEVLSRPQQGFSWRWERRHDEEGPYICTASIKFDTIGRRETNEDDNTEFAEIRELMQASAHYMRKFGRVRYVR